MFANSIDRHSAGRREITPHRRLLLKGLAALPLALPFTSAAATGGRYRLKFRHTHTDERLDVVYRDGSGYLAPAIERMNWLMRDFRSDQTTRMDPRLFDILHALTVIARGGSRHPG